MTSGRRNPPFKPLHTERLVLLQPGPTAAHRMVDYYVVNAAHLAPFEPERPQAFLTEEFWDRKLDLDRRDFEDDLALRLVLVRREDPDGPIAGTVAFTNIIRGPFQACYLGYGLAERAVGQGLMHEALEAGIAFMFRDLGLHRIMANYLPTNERSGRVLRRLGFAVEGYARDYLYIAGAWRDHVLTSLVNPACKVS